MTLNLARGTERLERRLRERSRKFGEEFKRLEAPDDAFGFRITAVPVGDDIRFGSVYSRGNLIEELRPPEVEIGRGSNDPDSRLRTIRSLHAMHFHDWRPMLRAARVEERHRAHQRVVRYAYAEIYAEGLLEWGFLSNRLISGFHTRDNPVEMSLDSETPVSSLARLLVWADNVRQHATAPGAEYAVQPQFRITSDRVDVGGNDDTIVLGTIKRSDTDFPLYPVEAPSEIDKTVSQFEGDFWNYFGQDPGWRLQEPLVIVQALPRWLQALAQVYAELADTQTGYRRNWAGAIPVTGGNSQAIDRGPKLPQHADPGRQSGAYALVRFLRHAPLGHFWSIPARCASIGVE
ncbi:MAG: hypothetical protein OXC93_08720 [Rhodospirillaceae bacterium]|nr:hypothetical protein [Rhodospirillaceae bacterium]